MSEDFDTAPRLRDGLRDAFLVYLGARILLFVLSAVGVGLLPLPPMQPTSVPGWQAIVPAGGWGGQGWEVLFTATERQDALWFLRIASQGYRIDDVSAAFFPLFPMLVRIVAWLPGLGTLGAALIVSNAATLGALVVLHALTRLELGRDHVPRSLVLVSLFPTGFFLLAPYTESLFLLLSLAAFWFARRDRWALAATAGALAAITRSVGVLLILGLWVEAMRQWRRDGRAPLPRLAAAAAVGIGPLLTMAWWAAVHQDFWRPLSVQANWRPDGTAFPLTSLWHAMDIAARLRSYWLIDLLVVGLAVAGIVLAAQRIPSAYTAYAAGSIVLPLLLPFEPRPLLSVPRFVVVLFPAAWGWSLAAERGRPPMTVIVAGFAAGYGLLSVLFVNWHFIF